jgi:endonuclease-8
MTGSWRVVPRGVRRSGRPWLILRGAEHEAVLWNGPVLELDKPLPGGADILDEEPDYGQMAVNLRGSPDRQIGDALLDQRLVMGIGNIWRSEALWDARVSPWKSVSAVSDGELTDILEAAHRLMAASAAGARPLRRVYRRAGRPCGRCGTPIRSHAQGDAARIAYWCPTCQRGGGEPAT